MKQLHRSFYGLLLMMCCLAASAQEQQPLVPPYQRFPTLPPLQLLLGDSTSRYTKADLPRKKPVLYMLFSPDCSHCQQTAREMLEYKEELKKIHIVMATLQPLHRMNDFMREYRLNELDNVVVGKDIYIFMPSFYGVHSLPYLAFYNKKGDLIKGFEGSMPVKKMLEVFDGK